MEFYLLSNDSEIIKLAMTFRKELTLQEVVHHYIHKKKVIFFLVRQENLSSL